MLDKPLVTVSGKKILFKSDLHQRIISDIPQEGVEWRRRLDSNTKSVYIDVDFVDFDVDNVERSSERLSNLNLDQTDTIDKVQQHGDEIEDKSSKEPDDKVSEHALEDSSNSTTTQKPMKEHNHENHHVSQSFFNQKLLGRPVLHTYWADKADFEDETQKTQFDEWIGKVQASTCTEWAIIIIEDGDFKTQIGTALFKSKLQSSASKANESSASLSSMTQTSTTSFLDRMKKGLSTIFQSSHSDRWLTLVNQDRLPDNRAQESYTAFLKKLRNVIMASFSKQIELFEEHLRVQREMRNEKGWNFFAYFSMQEELAFAFEFLTLFDEALVQYDLLDALYTEYISSPSFNKKDEPLYDQWTSFKTWRGLCLDMNCDHSQALRKCIVEKTASLLDIRNYLFAKQCDLMLMQNQPWRVAASTIIFLQNCFREHEMLGINASIGALTCWSFISALEVLQKCECYSCTSTMENYSLHTVDIWNFARKKLLDLGHMTHLMPDMNFDSENEDYIKELISGLGPDPHSSVSSQARLTEALSSKEQFSKQFIEMSELTLGTYKHIGRKRQALLVGRELADFYIAQKNYTRALPFLLDMERVLQSERWQELLDDVRNSISKCYEEGSQSAGTLPNEVAV